MIAILTRADLISDSKDTPLAAIAPSDFFYEAAKTFFMASVVIFMDSETGHYRIMKDTKSLIQLRHRPRRASLADIGTILRSLV